MSSIMVRIKKETEELVELVSDKMNIFPFVIRNLSIILGLKEIVSYYVHAKKPIVEDDDEFKRLFEMNRAIILKLLEEVDKENA
jgi:hypothetical protein